jgi:opacity protein-like surface antigen
MLRQLSLIALLAGAAPLAQAADNGFYLGAGYAQSDYGFSNPADIEGIDDEDGGFKVIAGFRLLDSFAVEANYIDHGDFRVPPSACGPVVGIPCNTQFRGGAETISAFAVGFLDFPLVDLFAKVGGASWQFDGSGGLGTRIDESDFDFAWGAGVQAHFLSLAARLEYEQFKIVEDEKLDTISLSFIYTFL